ncbi:hypothetical protein DBR45_35005 [Pseudomonas sp. HMWF031]|nr:hypothetical protein DBR45_35005 [Pseudomonas sp. HMWF031]
MTSFKKHPLDFKTQYVRGRMTALRRTVRIRRGQMPPLDLQTICDKCNKSRAHGNHEQCSKQRQTEGIARRAMEEL